MPICECYFLIFDYKSMRKAEVVRKPLKIEQLPLEI